MTDIIKTVLYIIIIIIAVITGIWAIWLAYKLYKWLAPVREAASARGAVYRRLALVKGVDWVNNVGRSPRK